MNKSTRLPDQIARALTREEMEEKLVELAPFHHGVELPFGLNTYQEGAARHSRERTRLDTLYCHLWSRLLAEFGGSLEGLRVLDVACNCGGFSVRAAQADAAEVVGVDVEESYIRQATFIRDALELKNLSFQQARLEDINAKDHGEFDVTFFFGILYHLENPIDALKRISAVTKGTMVVDTTLLRLPYINRFVRSPLWNMRVVEPIEEDSFDVTTGKWRKQRFCQFYPNRIAVEQALHYVGFPNVEMLKPIDKQLEKRYFEGKRATFIARR